MTPEDRIFWMAVRQALLMMLDAMERRLDISPRTSELRKQGKALTQHAGNDTIAATMPQG